MAKTTVNTTLLYLSVTLNVLTALYFAGKRVYYGNQAYFTPKVTSERRWDKYLNAPPDKGEIVFVGTSITLGFPLYELYHNNHIKNLGFGGAASTLILKNVRRLIPRKPGKLFLECGINDLKNHRTPASAFINFINICTLVKTESPNTELYIQSVFPTATQQLNTEVVAYNKMVAAFCKKNNITYIDLYSMFLKNGVLDPDLTLDGVHLNGMGYYLWGRGIASYIH